MNNIRVVLAGVTGWVGRALLPAIVASSDLRLVAAVARFACVPAGGTAHAERLAADRLRPTTSGLV